MSSNAKAIKRLIKEATSRGWEVTQRKSGHLHWRHANGVVYSSLTPGDWNAVHQIERDLRKVERR